MYKLYYYDHVCQVMMEENNFFFDNEIIESRLIALLRTVFE